MQKTPGRVPAAAKPWSKAATTGTQPRPPPRRPVPPLQRLRTPARAWPLPPLPSPHGPALAPEQSRAPGRRPAAEGGSAAHLRSVSWSCSEGRGAQGSAARRLKLCCSRDGAVVTSSRSRLRGPGCDPATRAAARRALQPPASAPDSACPGPGARAPPCAARAKRGASSQAPRETLASAASCLGSRARSAAPR